MTEGGREGSGTFTVKPASAASVSLAFNPAEATVGTGDELTVKALDPYGNLATTSYANGAHTLTFGGAANGPAGAEPRVTDRTGAAKPFGQPTEIEFSGAEAHVEAGRNGLMTLYSAEEAHVTVTDGSLKNGVSGQPIKVKAGEAKSFRASARRPPNRKPARPSTSPSPRSTPAATSPPATVARAARTRRSPTPARPPRPPARRPNTPARRPR